MKDHYFTIEKTERYPDKNPEERRTGWFAIQKRLHKAKLQPDDSVVQQLTCENVDELVELMELINSVLGNTEGGMA